jgi:ribose 5-phosphate isomerase B
MEKKIIGVASDHAGYEYKNRLAELLTKKGYDVADYGTYTEVSCDFPDFAHSLAEAVSKKEVEVGVALCGTGNGMAMTLNKHEGIRAGIAWNSEIARLIKAHNDANVLVMPARFISYQMAVSIVRAWLTADFAGGRHQRRIDKIPL